MTIVVTQSPLTKNLIKNIVPRKKGWHRYMNFDIQINPSDSIIEAFLKSPRNKTVFVFDNREIPEIVAESDYPYTILDPEDPLFETRFGWEVHDSLVKK